MIGCSYLQENLIVTIKTILPRVLKNARMQGPRNPEE
jgi:hypothetical protein